MKKIKYIAFSVITLFVFSNKVLAAGSISVNKSQVTVGGSFTVTANISGAATWDVHVGASGPVSGCSIQQAGYTQDLSATSKSWSATCTATGTGTINISLSGTTTNDAGVTSGISGSRTVTVVAKSSSSVTPTPTTPKKVEPTKSSNTKLEEFGVKDYKISPEFSNSVNDYSLTVPYDTTKVTIYTSRTSDKQKVTGNGEKEVKTGDNKFEVIVTAEDGTKRKINLNVIVDTKPIVIKLDNQDYTLIKNKEELPNLDIPHEDLTLTIQEQEVPAYRIDKISYVLVGMKDKDGNINFYKFDSFKNDEKPAEYKLVKFINNSGLNLVYLDFPKDKIPTNYKEYNEKIGDTEYTVYKLDKDSKFSLFYGINIETGKENIYKYESSENTVQLYEKTVKKKVNDNEKYKKLIIILGGVILFLLLLTTIGFTRKPKDKKSKKNDDSLTDKDIKKIEKTTKKDEKKNKKKHKKGELDF